MNALSLTHSLGFIVTYIAPLSFVLSVTMGKEVYDDYKRNFRDREANSQRYLVLEHPTSHPTPEDAYLNTHVLYHRHLCVLATLYFWRRTKEYLLISSYCTRQNHLEHVSFARTNLMERRTGPMDLEIIRLAKVSLFK